MSNEPGGMACVAFMGHGDARPVRYEELEDRIASLGAEIERMRAALVHIAEAWPSEDQSAAADWRVLKHIARTALSQKEPEG